VLNDEDVNMIVIGTRHNLHAPIIIEAANAGKHIFVEKPIAMSYESCEKVYDAIMENKVNLTMGFNRRFAHFAQKANRIVEKRKNPLMITYRINSAGMKKEHWLNDPVEGGGAIAIDDFKELNVTGLDGKGKKLKRIEKGQFELINEYGKFLIGESRNIDLPSVVDGVKATVCSLKVLDALKTGKVQKWDYVFS